ILAIVAAVVAYGGISFYVADKFTHPERHPITRAPIVSAPTYENVRLQTSDGLNLSGWFFPRGGDRAAIVVHGRNSNRIQSDVDDVRRGERIADFLIADGFSVLLFDLRGHGNSDGDRYSLGYYERRDVAAAIEYVMSRGYAERRIALLGVSLGAGTVLQELALHPNVGPIVTDSAYEDVDTLLQEKLEQETKLVPSWFTPGVLLAASVELGISTEQVRPIAFVRAHPERAFLFIHCAEDEMVPLHHAQDLKAASQNAQSQLWIESGCQHAQGYETHPAEYQAHVLAFLDAQLQLTRSAHRENARPGTRVDFATLHVVRRREGLPQVVIPGRSMPCVRAVSIASS
ncbi:MAG: hypothetical protein AUH85_06985, partial [Chloroflexi bacterium 13_1_40CM_4_68_4]